MRDVEALAFTIPRRRRVCPLSGAHRLAGCSEGRHLRADRSNNLAGFPTTPDCTRPVSRSFGCIPRRNESFGTSWPHTASWRRCSSSRVKDPFTSPRGSDTYSYSDAAAAQPTPRSDRGRTPPHTSATVPRVRPPSRSTSTRTRRRRRDKTPTAPTAAVFTRGVHAQLHLLQPLDPTLVRRARRGAAKVSPSYRNVTGSCQASWRAGRPAGRAARTLTRPATPSAPPRRPRHDRRTHVVAQRLGGVPHSTCILAHT